MPETLVPTRPNALPEQTTADDAQYMVFDGTGGLKKQSFANVKAQLAETFAAAPETFNPATSLAGGVVKVNTSEAPGVTPIVYKKSEVDARLARVNVLDYGAVGDGVTDDTAAVAAAYAAISSVSGGVLFFPLGDWRFNLTILKPNVEVESVSGVLLGFAGAPETTMKSRFIPANTSLPVIQVGNDTGYVRGVKIRDCTFYGANTGAMGVYFAGGAFECSMEFCALAAFTTCIKIQGGTTYPASIIYFDRVHGIPNISANNARGWLIANPANFPTSYTSEIDLINCHWGGPSGGTNSYVLEVDSCEVKLENCYFDIYDGHGVKVSNTLGGAALPWVDGINTNVDSGLSTRVAVEGYDNAGNYTGLSTVNFQINGKWKDLDGTLLSPTTQPITILRRGSAARGILQILASGGTSQLIFTDLRNNVAPDLFVQSSGTINIRADGSGSIKIGNKAGLANAIQINPDGSTFFFGASLSPKSLTYLDSNGQSKSIAPTITAPGTTGARTINAPSGRVNFAAAAQTLVVTNNYVTTGSTIFATIKTDDTTAKSVIVSAQSSGSFTLKLNAAATAETAVDFLVVN